jgi:hypothetical protein
VTSWKVAVFIEDCEGIAKSIIRLRNTKLEDELFSKRGGNVTVLEVVFHVTWSRALARLA